jgi:glycine cleavage system H protein
MALVDGKEYPEHLYYDLQNQMWYEPLPDGSIRAGFTPLAIALAGEVLVFAPKRIGRPFEAQRSFAIIECGKWVGAARAAFNGVVVSANAELERKPRLLNEDAFGTGWMLIVRADNPGWRDGLLTGAAVGPAFAAWLAAEAYKGRTE